MHISADVCGPSSSQYDLHRQGEGVNSGLQVVNLIAGGCTPLALSFQLVRELVNLVCTLLALSCQLKHELGNLICSLLTLTLQLVRKLSNFVLPLLQDHFLLLQ